MRHVHQGCRSGKFTDGREPAFAEASADGAGRLIMLIRFLKKIVQEVYNN